jgi:hypothetical protein
MWLLDLNKFNDQDEEIFMDAINKRDNNIALYDVLLELQGRLNKDMATLVHHYCYIVDRVELELKHYRSASGTRIEINKCPNKDLPDFINTLNHWMTD